MDRSTRKEFETVWASIDKVLIRFLGIENIIERQNKKVKKEISNIVERLAKHSSDIGLLGTEGGIHQELIFDILRSLSQIHPDNFKPHPMDEYFQECENSIELGDTPTIETEVTVDEFLKELPTRFEDPDEFKHLRDSDTASDDDNK